MRRDGFTRFPNHLWTMHLSPGAKLTYLAIASFAYGAKKIAWPSQPTLASLTGYSERSIRRFTAELEKAQLVTVERKAWGVNRYHLAETEHMAAASATTSSGTGQDVLSIEDAMSPKEDKTNKSNENNTRVRSSEDTVADVEKQISQVRSQTNEEDGDSKLSSSDESVSESKLSEADAARLKEFRLQNPSADLADEEFLTRPEHSDNEAYNAWCEKVWLRRESERNARQYGGRRR